jgi:methylmalonyl-CoA mutase
VNILRTTVACFSAAVGGADSITILPFDHRLGLPDAFSRRLARNTQIVLQEESSLNRVIDPAGGSWFVETLTEQLAQAAWTLFQEIESVGGMAAALVSGKIREKIETSMKIRLGNLATRRDPLTGVSEFPNIHEAPIQTPQPDQNRLLEEARRRMAGHCLDETSAAVIRCLRNASEEVLLAETLTAAAAGAPLGFMAAGLKREEVRLPPLLPQHYSDAFERLRDLSDSLRDKDGKRRAVFLANLGPVAQHTARATFAKNYFEAGGIEAIGNDGFVDAAAAATAFRASGAKLVVLCGPDELYSGMGIEVVRALKEAGALRIYLAGAPGKMKEAYLAAGVEEFIFVGSDVIATLGQAHGLLNEPSSSDALEASRPMTA